MLKPLEDRVIIAVKDEEEQTVGGIVLASNAKQKPQTGKVVAVGTGTLTSDGKRIPPFCPILFSWPSIGSIHRPLNKII